MTKIINNRPLFYCLLAFGLGIFLTRPIFSGDIESILFIFFATCVLIFLCLKFKLWRRLFLILICFCLGMATFFISCATFNGKDYGSKEVQVIGRVCVMTEYDNSQRLILDNVKVEGTSVGHNVSVFVYSDEKIAEGSIVSFKAELSKNNLFTLKNFNSYTYKYNVLYSASVYDYEIVVEGLNYMNWAEKLKIKVKNLLFSNMGQDEASVSYASLFGDKTFISDNLREGFSLSGIAHLLAVSGLHVGFVVIILSYILKRLGINKYARVGIFASFLAIYCYLCSFSASVVRASLMFTILELAKAFGEKYDRLNAWSIAGIICILYKPLCVFDPGFLLSFACVFCIFMFAKPMEELLLKWHLPKSIASTFGVMIPVQFGIIPLMAMYIKEVSVLSLLSNFICIPIFEIFFMLLFLFVPLVLIFPILKFLLILPELLIGIIIDFANVISSVNWAIITLTTTTAIVVIVIYLIMFLCSHFVNLKSKTKTVFSLAVAFIALVLAVLTTLPQNAKDCKITTMNVYGSPVYCVELNGVSFAVGEFNKSAIAQMSQYANCSHLYKLDYYISLNYSMPEDLKIYGKAFCYSDLAGNSSDEMYLKNGIKVKIVYAGDVFAGVILTSTNNQIFVANSNKLNHGRYLEFAENNPHVSMVLGEDEFISPYLIYLNEDCLAVTKYGVRGMSINNEKQMNENFSFEIKNDKICNMRGVD